jgi:hypothetical protein
VLSRSVDDKPVLLLEELLDELVELAPVVALLALKPGTGAAIAGLIP